MAVGVLALRTIFALANYTPFAADLERGVHEPFGPPGKSSGGR
jgi:hypothetical protein